MLPHSPHQLRSQHQQQPGLPSFMGQNPSFDPAPYSNMDPSAAAKQMAALTAASQARIANGRPPPASLAPSGTSSAPYLGGTMPGNYPAGGFDSMSGSISGQASFQMPIVHGSPPLNSALPSFLDPSMSQSNSGVRNAAQNGSSLKQRQQGFLNGLASVMAKRGTPLPPALTGIPVPHYDPNNTPWKIIEPSTTELGSFRLAGKDINLFKLWGLVFQQGGGAAFQNPSAWAQLLPHFDLPEDIPLPPNGSTSVAGLLARYYDGILRPFEEAYKQNIQSQQKRAQIASRQGVPPNPKVTASPSGQGRPPQGSSNGAQSSIPGQLQRGGMGNAMVPTGHAGAGPHAAMSTMNGASEFSLSSHIPQTPLQRPSSAMNIQPGQNSMPNSNAGAMPDLGSVQQGSGHVENNILAEDAQGIKRKLDGNEGDSKRARQKTGSEPPESISSAISTAVDRSSVGPSSSAPSVPQAPTTMSTPQRPRQQPSRRKIEYVPLAREVETFGGRDLKYIETEMANLPQRHPVRDINEWGTVDIEALTMSIRSRLSTELSYALTTFTLLSTMRGQTPGSGFPVHQCVDLLDEVLDLLEEQAFGDAEDVHESMGDDPHITTNRELVDLVHEVETSPFAALEQRQGSKDPDLGPRQRPGITILAIMNLIRNLSIIPDNQEFLSRQERLIDLLLRVCTVTRPKNGSPSAASLALSLGDLVTVRKDTLYILINIAGTIHLSSNSQLSPITLRMTSRAFQLIASYLVDPVEAVSPLGCIQLAGIPLHGNLKPPLLADMALEVFTRLSQADLNRQIIAKAVPEASIWRLFSSLIHRLPMVDADFQLVMRETWLSYLEKIIMAIYSLAFLAPPSLKRRVKIDRQLGFKTVMLRMIPKFLMSENRGWFLVCARRAVEAMKVLDDAEDSFDTSSKAAVPTMSFGMGYGEVGGEGGEKGTGLLAGHRDVTWEMLMLREVHGDAVMFGELESLARVEC